MKIRIRSPRGSSVARNVAVVVPITLLAFGAAIGVTALAGLDWGILTLFVGIPVTFIPAVRLARRVDYARDADQPHVRLEDDALLIPDPDGGEWRLDRARLRAAAGWYNQRHRDSATRIATGARGVFLHVRDGRSDVVLLGEDALGDVGPRGIKRYTSPPADKPRPVVRVWALELLELAEALGACEAPDGGEEKSSAA